MFFLLVFLELCLRTSPILEKCTYSEKNQVKQNHPTFSLFSCVILCGNYPLQY